MRTKRTLAAALTASALALGCLSLAATPAAASGGACPPAASGFGLWDIEAEPYQADDAADVNGDGWVCARATKLTFTENGQTYTVYLFLDDNVPA